MSALHAVPLTRVARSSPDEDARDPVYADLRRLTTQMLGALGHGDSTGATALRARRAAVLEQLAARG